MDYAADFKRLRLGILLPMTGDWPIGRTVIGAVSLAVDDVNNDPGLLPGRKLEYAPVRDDACNKLKALQSLSTIFDVDGPIDFVIGPGCSGGCISTATLAQAKGLAQISPFCGSGAGPVKQEGVSRLHANDQSVFEMGWCATGPNEMGELGKRRIAP